MPTPNPNSPTLTPTDTWLEAARQTLRLEAEAIHGLVERIGPNFQHVISLILQQEKSRGKVVFTGIGKSADVARKTVATLNSTGTQAAFLHAADALHGDLGLVDDHDVVIAVSKSGATAELQSLLPLLNSRGLHLVAMVGKADSPVGRAAAHVLDVGVQQEACPHDLAPTSSSAAQLAMGDALAMALMQARGFSSEDFAKHHPGGSLGRRLMLRLGDLIVPESRVTVGPESAMKDVVHALSSGRVGAVAVMGDAHELLGIITDGDLRRAMERPTLEWNAWTAQDVLQVDPVTRTVDTLAVEALNLLEARRISQIIVLGREGEFAGFVHLHQLIDAGIR